MRYVAVDVSAARRSAPARVSSRPRRCPARTVRRGRPRQRAARQPPVPPARVRRRLAGGVRRPRRRGGSSRCARPVASGRHGSRAAPHGARVPWQEAAASWVRRRCASARRRARRRHRLRHDDSRARAHAVAGVAADVPRARPWRPLPARRGRQDITAQVALDQLPSPTREDAVAVPATVGDRRARRGGPAGVDRRRGARRSPRWRCAAACGRRRRCSMPSGLGSFLVLEWGRRRNRTAAETDDEVASATLGAGASADRMDEPLAGAATSTWRCRFCIGHGTVGPSPASRRTTDDHRRTTAGGSDRWPGRTDAAQGALAFGALGVVFGDIGTSPLYAFRESFEHQELDGRPVNASASRRIAFWALIIIISHQVPGARDAGRQPRRGRDPRADRAGHAEERVRPSGRGGLVMLGVFGTPALRRRTDHAGDLGAQRGRGVRGRVVRRSRTASSRSRA